MAIYKNIESATYKKINDGKNKSMIIRELIATGYTKEEAEGAHKFVFRDMMSWALNYMHGKGGKARK